MQKKRVLLSLFIGLSFLAHSQQDIPDSLVSLFRKQLYAFPQEKIYLHTDKPFYITGEKIWFRTHLLDAATHLPCPVSQYVYVELFNPLDTLITRVKIRKDDDAYHGFLEIPEEIPEGDYTLRAYTNFMLSLDEHYLCTKTVRIGNPKNQMLQVDAKFSFDEDGTTNVDFSFLSSYNEQPVVPKEVQMSVNGGNVMALAVADDGTTGVSFKIPAGVSKRILLLEAKMPAFDYRQFLHIPVPDNDFDVTFYPEGGSMLQGVPCRVAFKALKSNGQPANIAGAVYDDSENIIGQIKTDLMGMGSFTIVPATGNLYHAVCTVDSQQPKRFELPPALDRGYALSVNLLKEQIYVTVLKSAPEEIHDTLYLLAHTRGMVHFASQCDDEMTVLNLPKKQFPSGVLHLILFDAGLNPVSERLVFVNNDDQAQVSYAGDYVQDSFENNNERGPYQSDQSIFAARSLVNNRVLLTDEDGQPLVGNFSVAVTADNAVAADSTTNMLTQLLLVSDLRGNITNPAAYFRKDITSAWALDLLMLTQGWRRYDVAAIAQGRLARPTEALELGPVVSGRVKRLFIDRPVEKSQVSIATANGAYFDMAETDSMGRFSFNIGEQPDNTEFIVQSVRKSGNRNLELLIDGELFPDNTLTQVTPVEVDKKTLEQYVEKADPKIKDEAYIRMLELPEVSVTARMSYPKSVSRPEYVYSEEDIKMRNARNLIDLLTRLTGHLRDKYSSFSRVIIEDGSDTPMIFGDDFDDDDSDLISFIISNIDVEKITDMYISEVPDIPPKIDLVIAGKKGGVFYDEEKFHIKIIQPFGYQQPATYYSPKYDTSESKEDKTPDLRTTIHWQPVVQSNDRGEASFEFYSADETTSYSVVIEGLTNNGKIIRKTSKLFN